MAINTPADLRRVSRSTPNSAAISMVSSGSVDSASAPRAAVVWISEALNSTGKSAKNNRPSAATAGQSRAPGQRSRRSSATGSSSATPIPKRKAPSVSGSVSPIR